MKSVLSPKVRLSFALTVVLAMWAATSAALPKPGAVRPAVKLVDGWDRELDLARLGKPLLAIYEDKDDGFTNQQVKDDLTALEAAIAYRRSVAQIYVIDLTPWNYWPARGLAKNELQKWSNKVGVTMYVDFTGAAAQAFAFTKALSNVVLYDKDGKLLFAFAGPLPEPKRRELVSLVRSQVPTAAAP